MNIEEEIIAFLNSEGVAAYAVAPSGSAGPFCTVELVGGESEEHGLLNRHMLAVQSWAGTKAQASDIALKVDGLLVGADIEDVCAIRRDSLVNYPDQDGHQGRYQGTYMVTTY